ncbi:MBL fold metallo-hydrolase [Corynebacterium sp. CCM 9186]|uniref:MBL fold metallo-hydrolase n=1 Tax=Corynebacterium meridianum TaxID=2765363 RepID=UPI002003785A|nr:MBL fold metallo-hydrolase [Corynebacterium meridianum]MCK7678336.1 MBL fold metallo-hydrolase [Corynebacterium meridianum]
MSHEVTLRSLSVSEMDNNCYFLIAGDRALLIDAADDADRLIGFAAEHGAKITGVVTTHRHWDHVRALPDVIGKTGATHYSSSLDAPALPADVDVELEHGGTLEWEDMSFPVVVLRGHTPGGLCVEATIDGTTHLFVGDSLFPGGVGKTNGDGDFRRLLCDVSTRVFDVYPDETVIHPGHGAGTTVGAERPKLREWSERGW